MSGIVSASRYPSAGIVRGGGAPVHQDAWPRLAFLLQALDMVEAIVLRNIRREDREVRWCLQKLLSAMYSTIGAEFYPPAANRLRPDCDRYAALLPAISQLSESILLRKAVGKGISTTTQIDLMRDQVHWFRPSVWGSRSPMTIWSFKTWSFGWVRSSPNPPHGYLRRSGQRPTLNPLNGPMSNA